MGCKTSEDSIVLAAAPYLDVLATKLIQLGCHVLFFSGFIAHLVAVVQVLPVILPLYRVSTPSPSAVLSLKLKGSTFFTFLLRGATSEARKSTNF